MMRSIIYAKVNRKQGFAVTEEAPVGNGKTIDVLAVKNGRKTAFEIETGKSDIKANLGKVKSTGFDRIVFVATSPAAVSAYQRATESI